MPVVDLPNGFFAMPYLAVCSYGMSCLDKFHENRVHNIYDVVHYDVYIGFDLCNPVKINYISI